MKQTIVRKVWAVALACWLCVPAVQAQVPAEDFAREVEYQQVQLSPDGRYLSLVVPGRKQSAIAIIDVDEGETVSVNGFGIDTRIDAYWWVAPKRLVARPAREVGTFDAPRPTGDLVAFNHTGGSVDYLFGQSAEDQVGSNIRKPRREKRAARVVAPMVHKSRQAIVALDDLAGRNLPDRATELARLSTLTGARTSLGVAPVDTRSSFAATRDGRVLLASAPNEDFSGQIVHHRPDMKSDWKRVSDLAVADVLAVSDDGRQGYVLAAGSTGTACLFALDTRSGDSRELLCHPVADIQAAVFAQDTGEPIAAVAEPGRPEWLWADSGHADERLLRSLVRSFPDDRAVWPVSRSEDGQRWVLYVYSSRDPGAYYLFDAEARKISELVVARSWIDPEQMADTRPFRFKASDGMVVHGYITVPAGATLDKLPAVVVPHGGPFGVRDSWGWDPEVQFLASRGYAVIQVNYRGSAGYGKAFVDAGRGEYGDRMIDDITEAAQHQIAQGYVDADRLCIFGASYGGYAAMRSATRVPDLYQCVIAYVGIYDLKRHRDSTDYTRDDRGLRYFANSITDDADELRRLSPIHHLDKLTAPVFIVHGDQDERVTVEQAKVLRAALRERDHPHEYLVEVGEGHGFRDPDNIANLYRRIEGFLAQHIGG